MVRESGKGYDINLAPWQPAEASHAPLHIMAMFFRENATNTACAATVRFQPFR